MPSSPSSPEGEYDPVYDRLDAMEPVLEEPPEEPPMPPMEVAAERLIRMAFGLVHEEWERPGYADLQRWAYSRLDEFWRAGRG